ncbi:hypothetical protein JOD45_002860 [Scopulibacillus daqui]|uniref:GK1464-like domain-containing protein n=1 Tax=Scopulibacillus daqui TaxID=1469162 RepID=A0ABS2Q328_9BACL|nr:DUF5634 family protein [Scopulibacillus daqui]MBM7646628.1 hypothetical protein [Scopulibacillus daqui]
MEYVTRETILKHMSRDLENVMNRYDVDDVGIYEEQGEGDHYYIGYTVRKDGKVYMINMPFVKDDENKLAVAEQSWTIQGENGNEQKGFKTLDEVFDAINRRYH